MIQDFPRLTCSLRSSPHECAPVDFPEHVSIVFFNLCASAYFATLASLDLPYRVCPPENDQAVFIALDRKGLQLLAAFRELR